MSTTKCAIAVLALLLLICTQLDYGHGENESHFRRVRSPLGLGPVADALGGLTNKAPNVQGLAGGKKIPDLPDATSLLGSGGLPNIPAL